MDKKVYYLLTPGGTVCTCLEANSEDEAWDDLMEDAAHLPYQTKEDFINRGYEVCSIDN